MRQGIRRAAVAGWLMVFGVSLAHADDTCPGFTRPDHWSMELGRIDFAARGGPPEVAQAAAALRAGKREEAVALLAKVGRIPADELIRQPINKPYIYAVLDAQEIAWELNGCVEP